MTKSNKNKGFKVKNRKQMRLPNPMRKMVVSSGANFGTQSAMSEMQKLTIGGQRLDAGGLRYLKLLSDPCNAAFTGPAFEGEGSGLFFRTRSLITPVGGIDSVLQLCPQFIHDNYQGNTTSASLPESSPVMYNFTNSSGGAFGNTTSVPVAKNLFGYIESVAGVPQITGGSFGSVRAVAACIKVGYSGSVMNLAGRVFAKIGTQQTFSQAGTSTGATFNGYMSDCPQIDDLRSRVHEYRWVPAFDDQGWVQTPGGRAVSGDTQVTADSVARQGQVLTVGVLGAPAGSITYEITIVWEAQVVSGSASDLLSSTTAPPTGSTLNHILREIGNVGQWALSGKGQEQITGMFQGAGNLARTIKGGVADLFKIF